MLNDILIVIDSEISTLKQARALLAATSTARGGSVSSGDAKRRKKGVMSAEGRARIAAAQRKRWAKVKAAK